MSSVKRLFSIMTNPWVIITYLLLLVFSFLCLDKPLTQSLQALDLSNNAPYLKWVTALGSSFLYVSFFLLAALFFKYGRVNKYWEIRCWFLWFCIVIPGAICGVIKVMLGRARPSMLVDGYYGFYGPHIQSSYWSFPSGHTTTIISLVLGLSILFPKHTVALLITGLLVATSRILLTQHYLSDVLAGAYLALIVIGLFLYFWQDTKFFKKFSEVST